MATREMRTSLRIVPPGKKKCVWMEAGVVSYKLCDNNYDCSTCSYDHGMQDRVVRQKAAISASAVETSPDKFTETWVDRMMQLPAARRKCRYMITGDVDSKICPNAYECGNCSFDQMMQERMQNQAHPVLARSQEAGFEMAENFYYHQGHTWAKPEHGGRIRVGVDDFAGKLFGKISAIELPGIGQEVKQDEVGLRIRRNGDAARLLSPIDGIVVACNNNLSSSPELAKESPYEKGWLFVVEPTKLRNNLKKLYYGDEAHRFIQDEREKLFSMANQDMRVAADGGASVEDIFEELESTAWPTLVKTFFRT